MSPSFTNTYSLAFDGVDDYVKLSSPMSTSGTDWSISCWFKSSQGGGNKIFVGFTGAYYFGLNWNKLTFISSDNSFDMTSTSNMNDGNWHNIIYTYNYTTGAWKSYIDGVIDDNQTATTGVNIPAWQFFGARSSTQYFAECNLDEIAYFSTELTSENVTSIYNLGVPNDLTSLNPVAWYRNGDNGSYKSPQWLIPENSNKDKVSNYSLQLDGVDDYMTVATPTTLTDFTTSVWLHRTGNGNFDGIFGQDSSTAKGGILRYVSLDGTNITLYLTSGWTAMSGALAIDTWHHFALTYDSTANELKSYINGSLYTTISSPDFSGQNTNAHSFSRIGMRNGSTATSFPGLLDEIALWNTAKSASDITAIYNSGEPTTITGAIAHWRMGEQATFSTNWSIPDQVGSSTVASVNMTIEDRVGDAPNSTSNALSYNMTESDRETDVPS